MLLYEEAPGASLALSPQYLLLQYTGCVRTWHHRPSILLLLKPFLSHFQAINCGKPSLPDHGSVSGISTKFPHPVTFTCDSGYEIEGSAVRRCQANGTWSGTEATCKRKCHYAFENFSTCLEFSSMT